MSGPLTLTGGVYSFLWPSGRWKEGLVPLSTECQRARKSYWHQACAQVAAACTSNITQETHQTPPRKDLCGGRDQLVKTNALIATEESTTYYYYYYYPSTTTT